MEMRVEQLSAQADVSVDTIRYYQSKGLLAPPRREGRIAWYGDEHLERLEPDPLRCSSGASPWPPSPASCPASSTPPTRRSLGQLSGATPRGPASAPASTEPGTDGTGADDLCSPSASWPAATGIPLALLKALEAEGLLIPTRVAGQERYTEEDVGASRAGLRLLEWGIPLTDLLDLARRHNEATEATARQAVELFARHVRDPLRAGSRPDALAQRRPGRGRRDGGRRPAAGLRRAATGRQHAGRPPLHPDAGAGGPRPRRAGGLRPEREAVWDRIRAEGDGDGRHDGYRRRLREEQSMTGTAESPHGTGERPARPVGISLETAARARDADLPTGPEKTELVRSMFDAIAPRYDLVNRTMTFGLDVRWRRQSLRALGLPAGLGRARPGLRHRRLPQVARDGGYRAFGMDLSWGMLAANRTGLPLAQANGAELPVAGASVDGVTCGYALRNFTDLAGVFAEFARIVRPGGRISLLEVSEPDAGLLRLGDRFWFRRVVPLIGGLLSDRDAYRYLPRSTAYLPGTEELRTLLGEAGFSSVNRRALSGGLSQLLTATRAGRP